MEDKVPCFYLQIDKHLFFQPTNITKYNKLHKGITFTTQSYPEVRNGIMFFNGDHCSDNFKTVEIYNPIYNYVGAIETINKGTN